MFRLKRRALIQSLAASSLAGRVESSISPASLAAVGRAAAASVQTNSGGKSWAVSNNFVQREIRFDPTLGLYTENWLHKATGTDFMEVARKHSDRGDEFFFRVGEDFVAGTHAGASEFVEAKKEKLSPPGEALSIHLRATKKPIEVAVHYAIYDGHPAVRNWIAIMNGGADPVTLSHLSLESARIRPPAPEVLQVSGFYASGPREVILTGRVDDTDLFPFERTLNAGETFTTAKSSVAFVSDKGFLHPHWVMPSFTSQVLQDDSGRAPKIFPPLISVVGSPVLLSDEMRQDWPEGGRSMPTKMYQPEQPVNLLCIIEVEVANVMTTPQMAGD